MFFSFATRQTTSQQNSAWPAVNISIDASYSLRPRPGESWQLGEAREDLIDDAFQKGLVVRELGGIKT